MGNFVNIHTHNNKKYEAGLFNAEMYSVFSKYQAVSIGIHPWNIEQLDLNKATSWLEKKALQNNVLAIGECGIDRSISTSIDTQTIVFQNQVELAEKVNKPMIIHCVRAYSDMLGLRKKLNPKQPWIFHGFTGNQKIAEQLTKQGCYLSFGKALLHSEKVQQVFRSLPLEYVFLETDNSQLTIHEVYSKAIIIRLLSLNNLQEKIFDNFSKVFNKSLLSGE